MKGMSKELEGPPVLFCFFLKRNLSLVFSFPLLFCLFVRSFQIIKWKVIVIVCVFPF